MNNTIAKPLLFLVVIFLSTPRIYSQIKWTFKELSYSQGLSSNHVRYVFKDSYGFIWIGTVNGITRYDGYEFKLYNHIPGDLSSISNGTINAIVEDDNRNLWIGTNIGLNVYVRKKGIFQTFLHNPADSLSISNNRITCLMIDDNQHLWAGTRYGLNRVQRAKDQATFKRYYPEIKEKKSEYEHEIKFIFQDSKFRYWTAVWGSGLIEFNPVTGRFKYHIHAKSDLYSISGNNLDCIEEAGKGELWLYERTFGLNKFNPETGKFINTRNSPELKKIFDSVGRIYDIEQDRENNIWLGAVKTFYIYNPDKNDIVFSGKIKARRNNEPVKDQARFIHEDYNGIVWIAYGDNGIDLYDPHKDKFSKWYIPFQTNETYRDFITSLLYVNDNEIWVSSWDGGLIHMNNQGQIYHRYTTENELSSLKSNNIVTIIKDRKDKIWLGTANGLYVFDPGKEEIIARFFKNPDSPKSLKNNYIIKIREGKDGLLWIITEEGLNVIDPSAMSYVDIPIKDHPMLIYTRDLLQDSDGDFWFATEDGLLYISNKNQTKEYVSDLENLNSICSNQINDILQDKNGVLWLCTNNGISKFNKEEETFKNYFKKDGLINNNVLLCQEDEKGNIWFLTITGLSKFHPEKEIFINYDKQDGLKPKSYYIYKCFDGDFIITNQKGFYKFPPDSLKLNKRIPPVVFTEFLLNGESIPAGAKVLNGVSLQYSDKIILNYDERNFRLKFSALNYTSTEKNQYAYKIEGHNKKWQYLGTRRELSPINIKPGNYVIKVIGSNNDNIWNKKGTSIDLIIKPPWWQTWWAFLIYGLIIFSFLMFYRIFTRESVRVKNEMELEKLKARKIHEIDEMKITFFSNISHELRTPLTLLLNPLESYLQNPKSGLSHKNISLVYKNARRLHQLIDQLLDLRKLDVGKLKPEIIKSDIVHFVENIILTFSSYAEKQKIKLSFKTSLNEKIGYYDADKLEKVLSNLLTNALKYSNINDEIIVKVDFFDREETNKCINDFAGQYYKATKEETNLQDDEYALFTISDNGIGMEKDELEVIFDRFYQSSAKKKKFEIGSGIGLSLTKELIRVLKGWLFVRSNPGEGTTFKSILPICQDSYPESEIVTHNTGYIANRKDRITDFQNIGSRQSDSDTTKTATSIIPESNANILIVEDNQDMLNYLRDFLNKTYIVKTAENGKKGLEIAINEDVDLILSDLMMPEMDGIEFCKTIRGDQRTSHIPFILLTAKTGNENEIEGLDSGADNYIIKPFNNLVLLSKIRNTLRLRQELKDKFIGDLNIIPEGANLANKDEDFLNQIIQIVESDITNTEFDKEDFYKKIGMSRTQVYRKLKALTNQSVNEFIRNIRLKKAAGILKSGKSITIAELAYLVGFSNPNYFTRVFREYFGVTPTQYGAQFANLLKNKPKS